MIKRAGFVEFVKMHGAGNDYIYINTMEYPLEKPEELAIRWSAPHTGIGSDGLVLIGKSDKADFSMRIFNADGSEAMMCGNASRCIGKYVYEKGLTRKESVTLETLSGIKELKLAITDNQVTEVTVDMGEPEVSKTPLDININGQLLHGTAVSMGNPHLVLFVDDVDKINLSEIGPKLEYHPHFPERTNVEFAQLLDKDNIRMRVWERGSGITQACGTGACATAVAAAANGLAENKSTIIMDGGPLRIEWEKDSNHVKMTGAAVIVYEGIIKL